MQRLPKLASMHPFYAEIAVIASEGRYEELLDRCRKAIHLITRLYREYRRRIIESGGSPGDQETSEGICREKPFHYKERVKIHRTTAKSH